MPAITIPDLNNAKLDVDHIAAIATSTAPTATDRLGGVKQTMAGALAEFPAAFENAATATAQAGIATTQAGLSTTQAVLAATAKTAAETARDAANVNGKIYATTAAGLAAVASGAYFSVPSADSAEYLILYLNSAGTAVEQKRYPSAALVAGIASRVPVNPGLGVAIVFSDSNDEAMGHIDTIGGLNLLDMTETVQSAASRIPAVSGTTGTTHISATTDDEVMSHSAADGGFWLPNLQESVQATLEAALSRAKLALAANFIGDAAAREKLRFSVNAADDTARLFGHAIIAANGVDGTTIQRIPAVINTATHGLLVMWGQGYAPYNGDGEGVKLVRQNVAVDLTTGVLTPGATTLVQAPVQLKDVVKHPMLGKTLGGRIVLCYDTNDVLGTISGYYIYCRYSDDDGQTFSAPVLILSPSGSTLSVCSGSTGRIETMASGRLILPIYGSETGGNYIACMYSDDNAVTWVMGGRYTSSATLHEPAVSLDSTGALVFSVRGSSADGKKRIFRSADAGLTITDSGLNADLPGTPCASSMCYDSGVNLHSGPSHLTTRWRYRLRLSFNDAVNFAVGYTPFASDTYMIGCSCITPMGNGVFAVAYEGGPVYGINGRENLGLFVFNLKEVYDHGTNS